MSQPPQSLVPTLNAMGYMIPTLDEISSEFVEFAAESSRHDSSKSAIDIGAAFGVATIAALKAGSKVIANDIEPRHLERLKSQTPSEFHSNLTLAPGRFPDAISVKDESLTAALLSRVMQFFDGVQTQQTADWLFKALAAQGKVFIVADMSVFLDEPALRKKYHQQKDAGEKWPGVIDNVSAIWPNRPPQMPNLIHILDVDTLANTFSEAGFQIQRVGTFVRKLESSSVASRPRETVYLVACKDESE